jgi:hypothetical protein
MNRPKPRNKPSRGKPQGSPWAGFWAAKPTAPPAQQPAPPGAFSGKVAIVIVRHQDRERFASLCTYFAPMPCVVCGRATHPTSTIALAQSLANKAAVAATWFCDHCAEMDNEALLDIAQKSLGDTLGVTMWRVS